MKSLSVGACLLAFAFLLCTATDCSRTKDADIRVVISPYQDVAMMVNIHPLGLDRKYQTSVDIKTIPYQDMFATLASRAGDVDIGFASLTEFLAKEDNINKGSEDALLFVFPAYVYKGGAFVTFRKDMQPIFQNGSFDESALRKFLQARIGLSKNTLYQMLVYQFARRSGFAVNKIQIVDIPFDEGLLAAEKGDLDVTAVGLTQLAEALKRGGRVLLNMDDIGFADITGFICKKSTLDRKRRQIESVIRMWFEATTYVMSDIEANSRYSLDYLRRNAATRYTIEEYKRALDHEYFPTTVEQAKRDLIDSNGRYAYHKIYEVVADFLVSEGVVNKRPEEPRFIEMRGE